MSIQRTKRVARRNYRAACSLCLDSRTGRFSKRLRAEVVATSLREVIWFVAGFPLDVAAEAGRLCGGDRLSVHECVERGAKVFAGDWNSVARSAGVQLAAIRETMIAVEEKEIRRAGGAIRLGHRLGFIVEIGEVISGIARFVFHLRRAVIGIMGCVVGADGDDADAACRIITSDVREFGADVFHERAMVADEHDEQRG